MSESQRNELRAELLSHEREAASLSQALARFAAIGTSHGRGPQIFYAAQLTRHRISMALIASRLGEPLRDW